MTPHPRLADAQRLVVKIGSALVVDPEQRRAAHRLAGRRRRRHRRRCARAGTEVIVVSSGAIALARRTLGLTQPRLRLEEKQAAAAVGQIRLAQAWSEALSAHGADRRAAAADAGRHRGPPPLPQRPRHAADAARPRLRAGDQRERHASPPRKSASATTTAWPRASPRWCRPTSWSCCPTSTASTPPIRAATPTPQHIPVVPAITPEIEAMGGEPPPGYSSGGMRTKLVAARIATQAGCAMAIALGHVDAPAARACATARAAPGSCPRPRAARARKRWIAGALAPLGALIVDAGAARALAAGRSLLPAGVRARRGHVRARRRGGGARPGRRAARRAACPPMPAPTRHASPAIAPTRSRPSWAGAGATRSSTATIWCCRDGLARRLTHAAPRLG